MCQKWPDIVSSGTGTLNFDQSILVHRRVQGYAAIEIIKSH